MKLKGLADAGEDAGKIITAEWGIGVQLLATGHYVEVDDDGARLDGVADEAASDGSGGRAAAGKAAASKGGA
ncbi:hypothetical protein [Oharaeibacter diazotrophicus]|uniref:Uncharacterized protein n=2 Tax=Oharaeibacter diazotrophicus TaxID=1920512 RepID=A0A4V3CW86_9HYPH|nr:hypothetical protein [Oharaeibacter diazotrophicus]TDP85388.1 hypothetical protein EDD54_2241 [Oharaeibacter diazotrophicus]BBE74358.1 hypothetical protein OHA_1_03989 [Pleomorphomonas sp. SM30]GLS75949.1 hypothetical protein GCM10007904_12840 [Oharaeibacter diazotrophicus]